MNQELAVTHITRYVRPLSEHDTVARALELLRATGLPALPVAIDCGGAGVVRQSDIHRLLRADPSAGRAMAVSAIVSTDVALVPDSASLAEALDLVAAASEPMLVVVTSAGLYRGVVTEADLLAAWTRALRPARIAGMATPLGVYLTTGSLRAGAGNIGLFLTGVCLAAFFLGSDMLVRWATSAIGPHGEALAQGALVTQLLPLAMMLLLIRLSPLAAYHAAEHQTVAAIEEGEALEPEVVQRMPRAHPRCGTNVMMILFVFAALEPVNPYLALIVSLVTWRYLGYYLQQYLTTRPASPEQLRNGLEAGKELLAKYVDGLARGDYASTRTRLWNLGWLQVAAGYGVAVLACELLGLCRGG